MKKENNWFSHDQNAMRDSRITLLMSEYGFAGYGRWWHLVEMLRAEEGFLLVAFLN